MAYKKAVKEHAKSLYVLDGKPLEEISKIISVPLKTLYGWRKKNNWDDAITYGGTINLVAEMQKAFAEAVKKAIESDTLTSPAVADSLYKTSKLMEKLLPKKMMLANIFNMFEDIVMYAKTYIDNDRFIDDLTKYLPEIADFLRKKYSEEA
jgi:hypothetical protein